MSTFSRAIFVTMSILLVLSVVEAGGLFSFSFPNSVRSGRQIRAPFKEQGVMNARGFGKRSSSMGQGYNMPNNNVPEENGRFSKSVGDYAFEQQLSNERVQDIVGIFDENCDGKLSPSEIRALDDVVNYYKCNQ